MNNGILNLYLLKNLTLTVFSSLTPLDVAILTSLGGLDLSRSRLSISTSSKSESRQSRKSRQRQKVCLNSREILIKIETSRFCLDINVQNKKSRSRSRNSSRSENFGVSRQFVSISIEKCVDFCIFLSRFLNLKRPQQCRDFLTNLDCVLTNLVNPNASRQILTILTKILTSQSLNWKNLNFKNLDREKKKLILPVEKISTIQKS